MRITYPTGNKQFFDGPRNQEYLIRTEFPNGNKYFYDGDERGQEHMVRATFSWGDVFFTGERDQERKVRVEFSNGTVEFYEGERGEERRVRPPLPLPVVG